MAALDIISPTRCTGECCKNFVVGHFSRSQLLNMALNAIDVADKREEEAEDLEQKQPGAQRTLNARAATTAAQRYARDVAMIASMIRPIVGEPRSIKSHGRWFTEAQHYFTCVHFDGTNCIAYEQRPEMCIQYPYGKTCEHEAACTWKEAATVSNLLAQRQSRAVAYAEKPECTCGRLIDLNAHRANRLKCLDRLGISPLAWADLPTSHRDPNNEIQLSRSK